jgi:hypothetical protein
MVCYFKAILGFEEISKLPFLTRSNLSSHDNSTGELKEKRVFESEGIKVVIKSDRYGYIEGSLHYYKNKGVHNYDDFLMDGVWRSIQKINTQYNIKVEFLHLVQLEFGLNIDPLVSTRMVLNALFLHQGEPFKKMYVRPGDHRLCHHEDYDIKIYDKRAQLCHLGLKEDLLRVELHANRARTLNMHGLYSLIDLKKQDVMFSLLRWLIFKVWPDIIFIDPEIADSRFFDFYKKKEVQKIKDWCNPLYWENLNNSQRKYQKRICQIFLEDNDFSLQHDLQMNMLIKARDLYQFPC